MGAGKNAAWLAKLAADDPDAAYLASAAEPPEDAEVERHNELAWHAFKALRFDRHFGAMSGAPLPLPFTSIDTYAKRYGIEGEAFDLFLVLLRVLDSVWIEETMKQREAGNG